MSGKYPHTSCGGMYKIPQSVKNEALKGLEMHRRGFAGGTITGWSRAKQLSTCDSVSAKTIKTMKAWYARHTYTSYPGYKKWVNQGSPMNLTKENRNKYRGAVAWLIWGGDPAKNWVNGINL